MCEILKNTEPVPQYKYRENKIKIQVKKLNIIYENKR